MGRVGYILRPNVIENCHCTTDTAYLYQGSTANRVPADTIKTYASLLGEAFTDDVQKPDGTWKYNNGYPILKWQLNCNK